MSRSNSDQNVEVLDRWFVQIKGQIVGPMPGAKVLARLIVDELTVMSRVSSDRKNWTAICNVPFFEELVNSRIRAYTGKTEVVGQMNHGGSDDTPFETSEVNFNVLHTNAVEGISEQLDHARQLEELTANIQKLNAIKKEIALKRKTVVVERDRDEDEEHPDDQNIFIPKPAKKFSIKNMFSGDVRHRKIAIISAVIFFGGLGGTVAYQNYLDHEEQIAREAKAKAETEARAMGEYKRAANGANSENINKNASAEELLALAESHLKEKNHSASQLVVKQALSMALDSSNRARAHAISAANSVAVGDLDMADTQYTESLKHVELYGTLHGVGILNFRRGQFEAAEKFFLKALQLPTSNLADRVITLIHLFESAVILDKRFVENNQDGKVAVPSMTRTNAALDLIVESIATANDGKDRLLLAKAMGNFYLGNKDAFQISAIELIDEPFDPNISKINSELEDDLAHWKNLVKHCAAVYNKPPVTAFGAAFYAACLSRSHGSAQALPFAKYAFAANSKDPLFGALYASILVSNGDSATAETILIENPSFSDSSKLARFVLAEIANKRAPSATNGQESEGADQSSNPAP